MKPKTFNKVLFHPGYLPQDELLNLTLSHKCLKLMRHSKKDLNTPNEKNLDIQIYPDHKKEQFSKTLKNDVEKTWSKIINDHQTSLIFNRNTKHNSEIFKFNEILLMCYTYQNWLETESPDLILFTSTPHNIKNWVLSKVAESIGIPVLFFQASFFPWRQFLLHGLKKNADIIQPKTKEISEKDSVFYAEYIKKKMGCIEDAMPTYEIKRLRENNWKLLKIKKEFKNFLRNPTNSIEKVKSYLTYKKLSKEIPDNKYVIFFLHYQPERTSIPEGYGFGIQLSAILALQQALPSDTYLVVKEHPSTYTYNFNKKYRDKYFYQLISSIDRVIISPVSADPYKIIDRSIATASVTGTVIGEAFVRGKPCIAFGAGPIQALNSSYFHRYQSINELRAFLSNLNNLGKHDPEKYFENVCELTFSGIGKPNMHYDENSRRNYLFTSTIRGINQLLSGELEINITT